jgi:hypothetical protein
LYFQVGGNKVFVHSCTNRVGWTHLVLPVCPSVRAQYIRKYSERDLIKFGIGSTLYFDRRA